MNVHSIIALNERVYSDSTHTRPLPHKTPSSIINNKYNYYYTIYFKINHQFFGFNISFKFATNLLKEN